MEILIATEAAKTETEIKPCRYCGSKMYAASMQIYETIAEHYTCCGACGARGPVSFDEKSAIMLHNNKN